MNLDEITSLPIVALKDRKITQSTCNFFKVHSGLSEANGEVCEHYYPVSKNGKVCGYKRRTLPKTFSSIGDTKGAVELFGQSVSSSSGKRLLITGGELDAMSAWQMFREKYPSASFAAVSLPKGENTTAVKDNLDFINSFDEVLIYTDMDEVGRKVADELAKLIGFKAKIVETSEKDASDMLKKGKKDEFITAIFNAEEYKPKGFVTVAEIFDKATTMPTWGKSWPWPTMTKLTYGRRLGEGIYFGAGVKVGKSEAVNQIVHHITQVEGGKVAVFKLEEEPSMTVRKVAGKIMHKQFHVPDGDFTQEELIEGVNKIGDSVILYDCYGSTSWDDLKEAIRYAVIVDGCQDIIIDPLTRLTTGMDSATANTELERIADEISKMSKDLQFFYMFFCHLKAPQSGKAHEEGGTVHSNQFTGSRAMMRACYYMVGIERDKTLDNEYERNLSTFVLLEDRAFGMAGRFPVYYNKETGDYLEPTGLKNIY
jgi:twinkle protein